MRTRADIFTVLHEDWLRDKQVDTNEYLWQILDVLCDLRDQNTESIELLKRIHSELTPKHIQVK